MPVHTNQQPGTHHRPQCSKCGLPKKGHVCEYQPRLRLRTGETSTNTFNAAVQVEMDPAMVVRELDLTIQGTVSNSTTTSPY